MELLLLVEEQHDVLDVGELSVENDVMVSVSGWLCSWVSGW